MALFSSCYDENNDYGTDLVESSFRNIMVDTCTVNVTSIMMDSLETSEQSVALVGKYTHPLWGSVTSTAYIPFSRPSFSADADKEVKLDSLVLRVKYNGTFVGDTTKYQQISIHRLLQKVVLNNDDYLYSYNHFNYDPTPLATYRFRPKPGSGNTLEIRLSDALGEDLLEKFESNSVEVNTDRFEEYFKGLTIVPSETENGCLMGFSVADSSCCMQLFYHLKDELSTEKEFLFKPNTETQFNHYDYDRSGTILSSYNSKHIEIPSELMNNYGVLFGGVGWYCRFEFPYINNLMQTGKQIEVESAILKLYPVPGTYSDFNQFPDSIYLNIADENNVVTEQVTDYLGTTVQAGKLVKDETYSQNTYYYFDLTTFMREDMGTFGINKHNLQLVLNNNSYTRKFSNLTFYDQHGKMPLKLQLTYKVYESY
jgi:hypothetical protein